MQLIFVLAVKKPKNPNLNSHKQLLTVKGRCLAKRRGRLYFKSASEFLWS